MKNNVSYNILVFGMTANPGGVESVIMNYYRNINKEIIHFDFLCNSFDRIAYEDELINNGSKIFKISMRSKHPIKYHKELNNFFRSNSKNYDAIWVNLNSLANIDYLKLAKKYGIKKRIIHSHNSRNMDNNLRGILHKENKKNIGKYATDFWACSSDAANFFYNDKLRSKVKIIKNAIDEKKDRFNKIKRDNIRKDYDLEDKFVIGNVGRLHFQKNQEFALKVLKEVKKLKKNAVLVLIGDGPDKEKLKNAAKKLKLEDSVKFLGVQKDIQAWLSAMDVFLFPSKFEGFGVAALEAEANGIPIISAKKNIPKELKINSNFYFMDLKESPKSWADKIIEVSNNKRLTFNIIEKNFKKNGWDIFKASTYLEKNLES